MNPHEPRQAEILRLRGLGNSYNAIANKYGISRERVRQIVERQKQKDFLLIDRTVTALRHCTDLLTAHPIGKRFLRDYDTFADIIDGVNK